MNRIDEEKRKTIIVKDIANITFNNLDLDFDSLVKLVCDNIEEVNGYTSLINSLRFIIYSNKVLYDRIKIIYDYKFAVKHNIEKVRLDNLKRRYDSTIRTISKKEITNEETKTIPIIKLNNIK